MKNNRRKWLACMLTTILLLSQMTGIGWAADQVTNTVFSSGIGDGSAEHPFELSTAADLTKLSELTNAAATNKEYGAYHYKLTADIDMTGAAFSGLNCVETAWNYETFTGTFDGEHPPMPPMEGIPPEFGNHIFEGDEQKDIFTMTDQVNLFTGVSDFVIRP